MANGELTYDDFLQRLDIQDILMDAGYHLNKRDGLRYPSYIRMDSNGTRIRGDKFIVTPNGKCCFQPPQQKLYHILYQGIPGEVCGTPERRLSRQVGQPCLQQAVEPTHQ